MRMIRPPNTKAPMRAPTRAVTVAQPERMNIQRTGPQPLHAQTQSRINAMRQTPSHSRQIEQLGSAYESNTVSTGQRPSYHPVVTAARAPAPAPKGK